MKENRLVKLSRHHNRAGKLKKAKIQPRIIDRNAADIAIIDLIIKSLYYNSHIDVLHIENDIFKGAGISVPHVESERLWEVIINTGLANPVSGFGNAGKLKLSRAGYQLMAQFGGYKEYMDAMRQSHKPDEIIDPAETDTEESDCKELTNETRMEDDADEITGDTAEKEQ